MEYEKHVFVIRRAELLNLSGLIQSVLEHFSMSYGIIDVVLSIGPNTLTVTTSVTLTSNEIKCLKGFILGFAAARRIA